jgi:predicted nucleic acid-binding protein
VIRDGLLDTGPLIALIDRHDQHHDWARSRFDEMEPPLLTCEAVLTEACYLAQRTPGGARPVLDLVERGVIRLAFDLAENFAAVATLMRRYANVPMSLADACLVRLSELLPDSTVVTLDGDFHVYRRHGRQKIRLMIPADR